MRYNVIILFCLLVSVGFLISSPFIKNKECDISVYSANECFEHYYLFCEIDTKGNLGAQWLIDKRVQDYHNNITSVKAVLLDMVILIVLGLLLILYRPDGINVSFLSINIPKGLLYLIVIFGIIYLWCNFGLEMNSAIDSRLALNHSFESLFHLDVLKSKLNPSNILVDNAFVDNWCAHYFDIFEMKQNSEATEVINIFNILGLFGLYGTLFGVLFGLCLSSIIQFGVRMNTSNTLANILLVFALTILISSNVVWAFKHYYSINFIAYIWFICGISILIWKLFGLSLAEKLSRLKKMKKEE